MQGKISIVGFQELCVFMMSPLDTVRRLVSGFSYWRDESTMEWVPTEMESLKLMKPKK